MKPRPRLLPSSCLLVLIICITAVSSASEKSLEKKVVCYYTNWSAYRQGYAKFSASNINPHLCTHLIYAFVGFSNDFQLKPFDKWQDVDQGGYAKFNGLKTFNRELKTLLAIGGWNEGSKRFSTLVQDPGSRVNFTRSVVRFLRQYNFDGFDLDWEYPGSRDGAQSEDKVNYLQLVKELRTAFDLEAKKTKRSRLLLTMAVPAGIETIEKGYDIPGLAKQLDFFNLLSYDYHVSTEPLTNHHAPLKSHSEVSEDDDDYKLTLEYTVNYYLEHGAPRHKLVVGIPTYGRAYKLFNPDVTSIGSPSSGPSEAAKYTREKGYMAYYEICERIGTEEWFVEKPYPEEMGPYAYSEDGDWVGFDDEDMVVRKTNFVLEKNLGGVMFWSLETDDFRGVCTGKPYPLLEAAKETLDAARGTESTKKTLKKGTKESEVGKSSTGLTKPPKFLSSAVRSNFARVLSTNSPVEQSVKPKQTTKVRTTEAPKPIQATPPAPPTPEAAVDFTCKDEGFFSHPADCTRYFWCLDAGALGVVANAFVCPSGLHFNKLTSSCDYANNVACKPTPPTTARPFLAGGTSLRTRPITSSTTPSPESEEYSFEDVAEVAPVEEAEETAEVRNSEEDGDSELDKLLDLIKELGGYKKVKELLEKNREDSRITSLQRKSLEKLISSTSKGAGSRQGPIGGTVPKETLGDTDFDPTVDTKEPKQAAAPIYRTITRRPATPATTKTTAAPAITKTTDIVTEAPEPVTELLEVIVEVSNPLVPAEEDLELDNPKEIVDDFEEEDDYEEEDRPIKPPPKSVNLQRGRPTKIEASEESEEEEATVRSTTTTTTTTTTLPTTTRKANIRPPTAPAALATPARRRSTPRTTTTITTIESLIVEKTSIGPIRVKPTTRKIHRLQASTFRPTTTDVSVEEEEEIPVTTRKPRPRLITPSTPQGRSGVTRPIQFKTENYDDLELRQSEKVFRIRRPDLNFSSSRDTTKDIVSDVVTTVTSSEENKPKVLPSFKEVMERRNKLPQVVTVVNESSESLVQERKLERFKRKDITTSEPVPSKSEVVEENSSPSPSLKLTPAYERPGTQRLRITPRPQSEQTMDRPHDFRHSHSRPNEKSLQPFSYRSIVPQLDDSHTPKYFGTKRLGFDSLEVPTDDSDYFNNFANFLAKFSDLGNKDWKHYDLDPVSDNGPVLGKTSETSGQTGDTPSVSNYRRDSLEAVVAAFAQDRQTYRHRHPQDKTWDPWLTIYTSGVLDDTQSEDSADGRETYDVERIFYRPTLSRTVGNTPYD